MKHCMISESAKSVSMIHRFGKLRLDGSKFGLPGAALLHDCEHKRVAKVQEYVLC